MEENLLLDAIERYRNGQMSPEEKILFEELRKNNPEIDQTVAEYTFFLKQVDQVGEVRALKHNLSAVEQKLEEEGILKEKEKAGGMVVKLWSRYRRTIGVAAAIAGIVSLGTASLMSKYSETKKEAVIIPLVDNKLNQFEHKLSQIEHKLNDATTAAAVPARPKFEANFRATGFLIDGNGYLITNAHVVKNARNLIVENSRGDQYYAIPVYANESTDLAILKINDSSFKKINTLPYTFSKAPAELAEPIFTLGYPKEEVVYGEGYLSSKSGYSGDTTTYQVTISVNPGNSGGPVINKEGNVIGVISSKETNADGVVFAIRSNSIFRALKEIRREKGLSIKTPSTNSLRNLDRVKQIKKVEDFVFKVKGN